MKKLNFFLSLLVILVVSCTKDDLLIKEVNPDNIDSLSKNAHFKSAGPVFQVADESDDDTEALLEAFALAQAAGKGAVVELLPGTFEIGMIEIREFFGTLRGSGMGASIITNLPDIVPDEVIEAYKLPALIAFIGGEVSVSDLSVRLSDRLPWLGNQEMNMLLFSDYSADFLPAKKYIKVNVNNIEVKGLLAQDVEVWPGGPVADLPYWWFNGIHFSMDRMASEDFGTLNMPRSNIDASVQNCEISYFGRGIYTWGCKKGNFQFGTEGGNVFIGNNQGLVVNENIGVNVKIWNNEFTIPDFHWNGIDLNSGEWIGVDPRLEVVQADVGTYDVRNNEFNIYYSNGMGIMDAWRYGNPDNPSWMKMTWANNTFNALADGAWMGLTFNLKNALFTDNNIVGNVTGGLIQNLGLYWIPPEDPNYPLALADGAKFLNNHFLQPDFLFYLDYSTKNFLIMGDLSNLIIEDYGVDNKFIGKTNYGHSNEKIQLEMEKRLEKMLEMLKK